MQMVTAVPSQGGQFSHCASPNSMILKNQNKSYNVHRMSNLSLIKIIVLLTFSIIHFV